MKVAVVYVTVSYGQDSDRFAERFVGTYRRFPPRTEHDTVVVCNGGPICAERRSTLSQLPNCTFVERDNRGWDIGAYVDLAASGLRDYAAMLCVGESIYYHRDGWLKRLMDEWQQEGPGIYGAFASNAVTTHINTTGFMTAPSLLREYPWPVRTRKDRYQFEHGPNAFWRMISSRQLPARLVTWNGCYPPFYWRYPDNILWRGDQSNCLMFCKHTDNYTCATDEVKRKWAALADMPLK